MEVVDGVGYAIGFLKPDCLKRNISQEVYEIIENSGLKIVFKKRCYLSISIIESVYHMCRDEQYYPGLCEYLLSGPIEIYIVAGDDAINRLQEIVGERGCAKPSVKTIRGTLATSARENVIHSTTDNETHNFEIDLLLGGTGNKFKV